MISHLTPIVFLLKFITHLSSLVILHVLTGEKSLWYSVEPTFLRCLLGDRDNNSSMGLLPILIRTEQSVCLRGPSPMVTMSCYKVRANGDKKRWVDHSDHLVFWKNNLLSYLNCIKVLKDFHNYIWLDHSGIRDNIFLKRKHDGGDKSPSLPID